jgi:hypothetical protein
MSSNFDEFCKNFPNFHCITHNFGNSNFIPQATNINLFYRNRNCRASISGAPHVWAITIMPNPFKPPNHAYPPCQLNSSVGRKAMRGHLALTGLNRRTRDASSPLKGRSSKYHSFYELPRTDNTINQEMSGPPCQVWVMSAYPS